MTDTFSACSSRKVIFLHVSITTASVCHVLMMQAHINNAWMWRIGVVRHYSWSARVKVCWTEAWRCDSFERTASTTNQSWHYILFFKTRLYLNHCTYKKSGFRLKPDKEQQVKAVHVDSSLQMKSLPLVPKCCENGIIRFSKARPRSNWLIRR